MLNNNNTFINDTAQELMLPDESSRIELVEAILLTLHRVFSYDAHNFVSQERFEILMQPIVDQIENTIGTKEEYESRADRLIVPCIASFASAIPDDSLHKQLVYQTLLKTRHAKPYVRSTAMNALVRIRGTVVNLSSSQFNLDNYSSVRFLVFSLFLICVI